MDETKQETPVAQNPTRSELIKSLGTVLSAWTQLRRGSTTITYLSFLNSPLPTLSPSLLPNSSLKSSKMAAVARSIRPFASRALAQKPLAPVCRAAPAFRFPRGTRSFSQSPLGELSCRHSWSKESPGVLYKGIGIRSVLLGLH